ncbi:MAG: aminotransferase class III-fold pyridoxal phosphate-dependent enzyme, partial [Candidatus Bathyarchaeia archaeon]
MERSWEELIDIDMKKYLHIEYAQSELPNYIFPVDKVEGCYIYSRGKKILDCMSQLYCVNIGQVNPKIQKAIKDALSDFGFVWEAFLTKNRALATEQLMSLVEPDGWAGRCKFVNTGSEANEENFIIAKLYRNAPHIMTRESAYHGWTEGPGQATRVRRVRGALTHPTKNIIRDVPGFNMPGYYVAPAPYCFKCPLGQTYPDCKGKGPYGHKGILACVDQTESLIRTIGQETFAAMITEIIMGAGTIVPPQEYIPQLTKMLKSLGVLWIDDEVICGFARTGKWFAYQHYPGVKPDLMTMGKGIVSSQLPAAGIIVS